MAVVLTNPLITAALDAAPPHDVDLNAHRGALAPPQRDVNAQHGALAPQRGDVDVNAQHGALAPQRDVNAQRGALAPRRAAFAVGGMCDACLEDVPAAAMHTPLGCTHELCVVCARTALLVQLQTRTGVDGLGLRPRLVCLAEGASRCASSPEEHELRALVDPLAYAAVAPPPPPRLVALFALYSTPGAVACPRGLDACVGFARGVIPAPRSASVGTSASGRGAARRGHLRAGREGGVGAVADDEDDGGGDDDGVDAVGGGGGRPGGVSNGGVVPLLPPEDLTCEVCLTPFCSVHGTAHANGRDACAAFSQAHDAQPDNVAARAFVATTSKPCPRCASPTHKTTGCRAMTCALCELRWCFDCGRQLYQMDPALPVCLCSTSIAAPQTPAAIVLRVLLFPLVATLIISYYAFGLAVFLAHVLVLTPLALPCSLRPRASAARAGARLFTRPEGGGALPGNSSGQGGAALAPPRSAASRAARECGACFSRAFALSWARVFFALHFPEFMLWALSHSSRRMLDPTVFRFVQIEAFRDGPIAWGILAWRRRGICVGSVTFWQRLVKLQPRSAGLAAQVRSGQIFSSCAAQLACFWVPLAAYFLFIFWPRTDFTPLPLCVFSNASSAVHSNASALPPNTTSASAVMAWVMNATNSPCLFVGVNETAPPAYYDRPYRRFDY